MKLVVISFSMLKSILLLITLHNSGFCILNCNFRRIETTSIISGRSFGSCLKQLKHNLTTSKAYSNPPLSTKSCEMNPLSAFSTFSLSIIAATVFISVEKNVLAPYVVMNISWICKVMEIEKPVCNIECDTNHMVPAHRSRSSAQPFLEGPVFHVLVDKHLHLIICYSTDLFDCQDFPFESSTVNAAALFPILGFKISCCLFYFGEFERFECSIEARDFKNQFLWRIVRNLLFSISCFFFTK